MYADIDSDVLLKKNSSIRIATSSNNFGNATASQVAKGVTFTSASGLKITGTGSIGGNGGSYSYPEGAFVPATEFSDSKEYALVTLIDGSYRYVNTTTYNNYTMNATQVTIQEDAGDYVVFDSTPALFTAVASGDGFLLQNGTNYLHGTTTSGTALRVGTTQAVWTVDTSETGGHSDGKYYPKENENAVWLFCNDGTYNWCIKYETAGSFGYDREGRDNTYSTGFVSFILFENVSGQEMADPSVDTSDATANESHILEGKTAYAKGQKLTGTIQSRQAALITPTTSVQEIPAGVYLAGKQTIEAIQTQTKSTTTNGTVYADSGKYLTSVTVNVPTNSGGVELPTLTNPGSADDLAQGKQLIGADGSVVEGNVQTVTDISSVSAQELWFYEDELDVRVKNTFTENTLFKKDSAILQRVDGSQFGNATADDVASDKTFTSQNGVKIPGTLKTIDDYYGLSAKDEHTVDWDDWDHVVYISHETDEDVLIREGTNITSWAKLSKFGDATAADVAKGKTFTSASGLLVEGTALLSGGSSVYPEGAFAPVTSFTDGKQYALIALIDGAYRYINTTAYNDYTMNATQVTISEDTGDYVVFNSTPALFTAVASGEGFLLQNGSNYLYGSSSGGTSLRVGTTQAVWVVDDSTNPGFSSGKYYAKEDSNSVWLINTTNGYSWSIKYETAGSFGYDREGRDSTYSTGFVSFILYEYVAGEGEISPIVDTSDANVTANKMLAGYSGYANGRKVEGNIQSRQAATITPSTTAQEIPAGVYLEGKQTISAIQTETKSVTENGTYTPSSGKYFSSFTVNVPAGSSGSVIKTGTTTNHTIATGLSSIEEFFIYKTSVSETGLINLRYSKTGGTSFVYASAWSTNTWGTKTITSGTTAATVSGGSITLPSSTAASGGLSSNITYTWVAVGTE